MALPCSSLSLLATYEPWPTRKIPHPKCLGLAGLLSQHHSVIYKRGILLGSKIGKHELVNETAASRHQVLNKSPVNVNYIATTSCE